MIETASLLRRLSSPSATVLLLREAEKLGIVRRGQRISGAEVPTIARRVLYALDAEHRAQASEEPRYGTGAGRHWRVS